MENCFCCGKSVTSKWEKKRRRPLSSPCMLSVLQTLTSLTAKFPGVDSSKLHTGYACRSCDGRMQMLISKLQSALPILPKFEQIPEVEEGETMSSLPVPVLTVATAGASPDVQCSQSDSPPLTVSNVFLFRMLATCAFVISRPKYSIHLNRRHTMSHLFVGEHVSPSFGGATELLQSILCGKT